MASLQAKPGQDRLRVIQKKKKVIVPIHSNPTRNREFHKNSKKKLKKLKKHHSGFISSQNGTGQAESDTKKESYRSDPFLPDSE